MKKENRSVPDDAQILYILRHWDEIHKKIEGLKSQVERNAEQYACAELEIKRLKKLNAKLKNEVKKLRVKQQIPIYSNKKDREAGFWQKIKQCIEKSF